MNFILCAWQIKIHLTSALTAFDIFLPTCTSIGLQLGLNYMFDNNFCQLYTKLLIL